MIGGDESEGPVATVENFYVNGKHICQVDFSPDTFLSEREFIYILSAVKRAM
jgi:uncharacterized protein YkuJ